jgi:hypothetical protein
LYLFEARQHKRSLSWINALCRTTTSTSELGLFSSAKKQAQLFRRQTYALKYEIVNLLNIS